jgi:hypothetical protein
VRSWPHTFLDARPHAPRQKYVSVVSAKEKQVEVAEPSFQCCEAVAHLATLDLADYRGFLAAK